MVALASVFVPVRPEFGNFARDTRTGLLAGFNATEADVAAAGQRHGRTYGQRFTREGSGQVRQGTSSFREGLGGIAAGMAAVAGVQVFTGFINDARESNRIGRITEQVIQSTGGAAHVTADQVGELATSISNKTGADDEAVQSAANLMLTFTGVRNEVGRGNDVFNQATQLAVDMSTALGTDASGAALQLGKALNDPIKGVGALARAGVSFTAQQKEQIKTLVQSGNTLGAQRIILAEVTREFGGAAAAASDPLQRLGVMVGNVGEDLGNALLPAVDSFANFMIDVGIPAIDLFVHGLQAVPAPVYLGVAGLGVLGGAVLGVNKAIGVWNDVTKGVNTVLDLLAARATAAAAAEGAQAAGATASAAATSRMGLAAEAAGTALGGMAAKAAMAGGVAGLALLSTQATAWSGNADVASVKTDQLAGSLVQMVQSGQASGAAFDLANINSMRFKAHIDTSTEAIQRFADEASGAFSMSMTDIIGRAQSGSERLERFNATAKQLDSALATMVSSGHGAEAKAFMDQFRKATGLTDDEFQHVTNRLPQYTAALAQVNAANAGGTASQGQLTGATQRQAVTLQSLLDKYPKFKDTVLEAAGATSADKAQSVLLTAAQVRQVTSAVDLKAATDALTGSLDSNKNATLRLRGGESAWYAALDDVSSALAKGKRGLDLHTASGRTNDAMLRTLASSGLSYLSDIQQNIGVGAKFKRTLDVQWNALYQAALRFTGSRAEARKYADEIYKVPKALATKVTTPGLDNARSKVQGLHRDINNLSNRAIKITVNSDGTFTQGTRRGAATGGPIPGHSPTPTADNIPIAATAGEHMWTVREVQGAGGHAQVERMRQLARVGALPRFASGGPINRAITVQGAASVPSTGTLNAVMDADMMAAYKQAYAASGAGGGVGPGGSGPIPGGSGVARWGPMVTLALAKLGLSQSLHDNWMRQIALESGGNAHAVQGAIGDVNNRTGDLAMGLVQVIGATFRAYHVAGTSWSRFDPWANLLAGMNYARHRYGSRMEGVIGHGHGYDAGGWLPPGGVGVNATSRPERVLDPQQSAAFERWMDRGTPSGEPGVVRLHPATIEQIAAALATAMSRQPVMLDGQTLAGHVDRRLGASGLSMRG